MLLKISIILFAAWLGFTVLTARGFAPLLLLNAIALAVVHLARRHRCGEPLLKFKINKH